MCGGRGGVVLCVLFDSIVNPGPLLRNSELSVSTLEKFSGGSLYEC